MEPYSNNVVRTPERVDQTRKRPVDQILDVPPETDDADDPRSNKRTKRSYEKRVQKSCLRCHVQKLKVSVPPRTCVSMPYPNVL